MKIDSNNKNCHSGNKSHKGHGWMMLLCAVLMLGVPLLILSSSIGSLNLSLLGTALLPLILCLIMHGVMMKFMMVNNKKENEENTKHQSESKLN